MVTFMEQYNAKRRKEAERNRTPGIATSTATQSKVINKGTPVTNTVNQPASSIGTGVSTTTNNNPAPALDQSIIDEIRRKANAGVDMTNPTAEKQAIYDKQRSAIENEIKRKAALGLDMTDPTAEKDTLYREALKNPDVIQEFQDKNVAEVNRKADNGIDLTNPENVSNQQMYDEKVTANANPQMSDDEVRKTLEGMFGGQGENSQYDSPLDEIIAQMGGAYDKKLESDLSALDAQRQQQLSEIKKAYNDAVAAGEMSVREAEEQYAQQEKAIDQEAYQAKEARNLSASQRGITNSQQLSGMESTDRVNKMRMNNSNRSDRDGRIADIGSRIDAITKNKALDVANTNVQFDSAERQATSNNEFNRINNESQMRYKDFQTEQQFNQQEKMANMQHGFNLETMDVQQRNALERIGITDQNALDRMILGQEFNQENIATQQENRLETMATQNGYNIAAEDRGFARQLEVMAKNYQMDLGKMAQANNYDLKAMERKMMHDAAMQKANISGQSSLISQRAKAAMQQEEESYKRARDRELAGFQKGTPEYEIKENQLREEAQQRMNGIAEEIAFTNAMENPYIENAMFGDVDGLPKTSTPTKKQVGEYNKVRDAIARYNDVIGNASGTTIDVPNKYEGEISQNALTSFFNDLFTGTPLEKELFKNIFNKE